MHRFATKLGDKHAICTETLRISSQAIYRASLPARSIGFHPIGNHYNLKTTDRTRERHKLYICYVIGYSVALMRLTRTHTRDNTNLLTGSSNIQDR